MKTRRSRSARGRCLEMESLEGRLVLSAIGTTGAFSSRPAVFEAQTLKKVPTATTVSVKAGTLSQPITFTVTVRGPASDGPPLGAVVLSSNKNVIQTLDAHARHVNEPEVRDQPGDLHGDIPAGRHREFLREVPRDRHLRPAQPVRQEQRPHAPS